MELGEMPRRSVIEFCPSDAAETSASTVVSVLELLSAEILVLKLTALSLIKTPPWSDPLAPAPVGRSPHRRG